ncbi:MAG: hypothetical protein IJU23_02065 [Proteobacteria bacterium]|nr:hypothetical protein [Pseudomonadota bacterium]
MISRTERNKLLVANHDHYLKLCYKAIKFVKKRYPSVLTEDLVAYAMTGVILALDRADLNNPSVDSYIKKYSFASAMEGARLMTGGHRVNKKGKIDAQTCFELILQDPMDLYQYIEEHQEIDWSTDFFFHDVDWKIDLEMFIKDIDGSYEALILKLLLEGKQLPEICRATRMDIRRVKRIFTKTCVTYLGMLSYKQYKQYLTWIPPERHFKARKKPPFSIAKSWQWRKHSPKRVSSKELIIRAMKQKQFEIASHVLYSIIHKI